MAEKKSYPTRGFASLDPARVKEMLRTNERGIVVGKILLAALDSEEALAIDELLQLAQNWPVPVFPITAKDLLARGMSEGKAAYEDALKITASDETAKHDLEMIEQLHDGGPRLPSRFAPKPGQAPPAAQATPPPK